jgi:hypothetical protein
MEINNYPEFSAFFNFRVKRLRVYIMADQLNQSIWPNNLTAPGYPAQNAMIRFGFVWYLVN